MSSYPTKSLKIQKRGFDALDLAWWVDFQSFDEVQRRLSSPIFDFGEKPYRCTRQRPKDYALMQRRFFVRFNTVIIGITPRPTTPTFPNVLIQSRSRALDGSISSVLQLRERCEQLIVDLGGDVQHERIHRVDLCADLAGITPDYFEDLKKRDQLSSYLPKAQRVVEINDHGKKLLRFGFNPQSARGVIYDKGAQLTASPQKRACYLARHPSIDIDRLTRVEFRLGTEFLDRLGIRTFADFPDKGSAVIYELFFKFVRFTKGLGKQRGVDSAWQLAYESLQDWHRNVGEVPVISAPPAPAFQSIQLIKSAFGSLLSAAAHSPEQFTTSSEVISWIHSTIDNRIRKTPSLLRVVAARRNGLKTY